MEDHSPEAVAWGVFSTVGRLYSTYDHQEEAEAIARMLAESGGEWEVVGLYRKAAVDIDLRLNLISCRAVCKALTKANADLKRQLQRHEEGGDEFDEAWAESKLRRWESSGSNNWGIGVARELVQLELSFRSMIDGLRSRISELENRL